MNMASESNFDSMLVFLSKNIGQEWQQVLGNLGITPARLEQYDMDEKYTDRKILRGLREWYGGLETTADRQKDIIDALSNSGLRSIAEEVRNKFPLQQDGRGAQPPCCSSGVTQPKDEAPYSKGIGNNRFVKVQTWEGEVRIDIRQWENGFNEMEPTKKGISLTLQQWGKFVQNMGKIDDALRQRRWEKIHLGNMKFVEVTGENQCVDLRVYWKPEGFLEPTRKGICLRCDEYMELKGVKSLISDSAEKLNRS